MRHLILLALIIPLIGTGCSSPDARAAAIRVEVTYSFKAGCITVRARDASAPERETSDEVEVLGRGPSTVRFAVFRKEDWGRTLEITTAAREQSCQGPVVDEQVSTVELPKSRIEPLTVTLEAPDTDGDGYMPTVSGGTDCDDGNGDIRPSAAEICDNQDNDCDGSTNEGVGTSWYPDNDGDGFGDKSATPRVSCDEPPGIIPYVQDSSDCQDSDATVFPRASAGLETRCDNVDEDCDGTVDDGFEAKGTACGSPCAGQYVCNSNRTALTCDAPMPESYYPDADGDGAGAQSGSPTSVCPGTASPTGTAANSQDCDDEDPYRRGGRSEACDSRDNTCDAQIDEGNVCAGKVWRVSTDTALTGGGRDWQTVAVGPGGLPVWVAGVGGVLAVRNAADQPFTSLDSACGNRNWRAAWVRPSDGDVFLVGDGAYVAQHTGNNCINATQFSPFNNLTGIVGFESGATTTLYLVDHLGRLYVWTPGSTPEERYNLTPPTYHGIHGLSPSLLLGVGGLEDNSRPTIFGYPGMGGLSAVTEHTLNGISGTNGSLRAVWMGASNLAYAVGDNGLVMKWVGGTTWDRIPAPSSATSADFTSVGMLDAHSIYVTDTAGRIWLRTATRWVDPPLYDTDKELRDIAVTSPRDIWAVGYDGRVLRFAE